MCGTTQTQTLAPPQTSEQTEEVTSRKKNALKHALKHEAKRLVVDRICKTTVELKPYELDSSVDIISWKRVDMCKDHLGSTAQVRT